MKEFKECWNVDLIKNSWLCDAIDEFLKNEPPRTCSESLRYLLHGIRERIDFEYNWLTPVFEDLKEGDEMIIMTSYGWSNGKWPEVLSHDTHNNLWGGDTLRSKFDFSRNGLRIKRKQLIQ